MIPARKSPRFSRWFAAHAEGRFRRGFQSVRMHGLDGLRRTCAAGPVLLVANHVSWWDALLCVVLGHRVLGVDGFAMMDAGNLRRYPFFARVGGFGVERGGDAEALAWCVEVLDRPGRLIWVYPQGAERPVTQRPLGFRRGSAVIARESGAAVVPLAIRYEPGPAERFELWLSAGPPVDPTGDLEALRRAQEAAVEAELDRIDGHLCGRAPAAFETLIERPRGRLQRLAEAALSRAALPPPAAPRDRSAAAAPATPPRATPAPAGRPPTPPDR